MDCTTPEFAQRFSVFAIDVAIIIDQNAAAVVSVPPKFDRGERVDDDSEPFNRLEQRLDRLEETRFDGRSKRTKGTRRASLSWSILSRGGVEFLSDSFRPS